MNSRGRQPEATTVAQAFSDVGTPYGFQERTHFALDTATSAADDKLMLTDFRRRRSLTVARSASIITQVHLMRL